MENYEYDLYQKAIEKYGEPAQMDMAIEEMSELTKAILKYRRNNNDENYDNIIEEMADVQIMLDQLRIIFTDGVLGQAVFCETVIGKQKRLKELISL